MKKGISVRKKVAVAFAAIGILLVLGVGLVVYTINYRQVAEHYAGAAISSAKTAAAIVMKDDLDSYLRDGPDENYYASYELLRELKESFNLTYLYILKPEVEKRTGVYVFDIYSDINDQSLISELGEPIAMSESGESETDAAIDAYTNGNVQSNVAISQSKFGHLASAYAPVYRTDGTIQAVVGVDLSMAVVLGDVRTQTLRISCVVLGMIVISLVIILLIVQKQAVGPVVRLSNHMKTLDSEQGELTEFEVPRTGDELQTMAESFNRMIGDINLYMENLAKVTAERERISAELDVATHIQASMLPCIFPPFPDRDDVDIYASMLPAREVGGDFYDFFLLDDSTLAVVIADVSGKGVPAALFMVIAKTLIKNNAQMGKSPKEVFETVNNLLCENNEAGMFVTAFMAYVNLQSGKVTYVNAGHNPPLVKKAGGEYEFIKSKHSLILAGMEDIAYLEHEMVLARGEILYLYTDGVTEAMNDERELFSDERLLEVLNKYKDCSVKELLREVKKEIDHFANGVEQYDDITMLALEMTGGAV